MGRKKETQVTHLSTGLGGKPGSPVDRAASDDDQDAIKSALAGARGIARGRGQKRGWEKPIAQARVFTDWAEIVGADVAAHCAPVALADGELKVSAESTAWATQLRMLGGTLLARVVSELGPTVVTRIVITGPSGPSWKHGKFTVRGQRGPRDTYG
jgi:predicted nucleic acid-binding Zn ribbon protein